MKKIIETVIYTCDWCGEELDLSRQFNPLIIVLDKKFFGSDVTNFLAIKPKPIVYIAGEPHHDICIKCINAGILKYAEGLKK